MADGSSRLEDEKEKRKEGIWIPGLFVLLPLSPDAAAFFLLHFAIRGSWAPQLLLAFLLASLFSLPAEYAHSIAKEDYSSDPKKAQAWPLYFT